MSNLCRMVKISFDAASDRLNTLKTKGVDTIYNVIDMTNGIYDAAASIIECGKSVKGLGLKWCVGLNLLPLYQGVLSETGNDNRMFVRKAERAGFENTHKLFTKFGEAGVLPAFARIDIDLFNEITGMTLSFEEQTRMLNSCINGVKAVNPQCKLIFNSVDSIDNEKAKKWFNRFQVSGGKGFDIISLSYELNADTFFTLSQNMSDLSRRFDKEIIVDISGHDSVDGLDIGIADLDSAIELVPMEKGFGIVYNDTALDTAVLVA
ncbi:MAG: glycosyl hydrolase 53 family protein [Eubacterium sp.]|nr:glycosyl hydrolase 53 family protein [Eubacterium sp.]